MFSDIKKLHIGEAPLTSTAIYTAPVGAGLRTQITRIVLHNSGSVQAAIELRHNHATNNILYNITLPAAETLEIGDGWQLENSEAIYAKATAAGVNVYIAGREKTEA